MVETKMFRDGNDIVVVFKNCSTQIEVMLKSMLQPVLVADSYAEPVAMEEEIITDTVSEQTEVPGNTVSEQIICFKDKDGNTVLEGTASELLQSGDKGVANIALALKKGFIPNDQVDTVKEQVRVYMKNRFNTEDPFIFAANLSEEECDNILKYYRYFIPDNWQRAIAKQAGSDSFDLFLSKASSDVKASALATIIQKWQKCL